MSQEPRKQVIEMMLGMLIALGIVLALIVIFLTPARAQTLPPPTLKLPSVELTGPQAKWATLGGVIFTGSEIPPDIVDAIVRQQDLAYLESVVKRMRPNPPTFVVGTVVGKAFNLGCEATVYLSGWVVETAASVQLRFDAETTYYEAKIVPTMPGYPKTWTFCLPAKYQDGKEHGVYIRALRASGTVIGPLDNAKAAAKWKFNIPATPAPTPAPTFTRGVVTYVNGIVQVQVAPEFTKVELLIDSRDVAPWYLGVKNVVDGRVTFEVPPAARDGKEHLLDVRLYKADAPGVFRPDAYPCNAVLAP